MIEAFLVSPKTKVTGEGDGPSIDIGNAANRVFLLTLSITNIIEQESLDVSIYVSPDGTTWPTKPFVCFPQKFYRGEHPLLLDLTEHADARFVRAHWEVARWGRGSEVPMFEFGVGLKEIPADVLREATAEAKALA